MSATGDLFSIINLYFEGGWRISPFFKGDDGSYRGVKKWPQRAAKNHEELAALCQEVRGKFFFGVVPAEGQYVVDIDMKGGKDGMLSWNTHLKEVYPDGNAPEPMCIVKSRSGGYHLYYHHTNEDTEKAHSHKKGQETRHKALSLRLHPTSTISVGGMNLLNINT